jgi:hypothetical protein
VTFLIMWSWSVDSADLRLAAADDRRPGRHDDLLLRVPPTESRMAFVVQASTRVGRIPLNALCGEPRSKIADQHWVRAINST